MSHAPCRTPVESETIPDSDLIHVPAGSSEPQATAATAPAPKHIVSHHGPTTQWTDPMRASSPQPLDNNATLAANSSDSHSAPYAFAHGVGRGAGGHVDPWSPTCDSVQGITPAGLLPTSAAWSSGGHGADMTPMHLPAANPTGTMSRSVSHEAMAGAHHPYDLSFTPLPPGTENEDVRTPNEDVRTPNDPCSTPPPNGAAFGIALTPPPSGLGHPPTTSNFRGPRSKSASPPRPSDGACCPPLPLTPHLTPEVHPAPLFLARSTSCAELSEMSFDQSHRSLSWQSQASGQWPYPAACGVHDAALTPPMTPPPFTPLDNIMEFIISNQAPPGAALNNNPNEANA